jgi:hypothetical protein
MIEEMNLASARKVVDWLCESKGLNLRNKADWNNILLAIDAKYDQRRYKCPFCKDSGIVSWIDPDDGLWYGRRCGYCRYWDEQYGQARRGNAG